MPELTELDAVVVESFVRYLKVLGSDHGRKAMLDALHEEYCFECGREQPMYGYCQCTNDE